MNVKKTHKRRVVTLDIGEFIAKETVYKCSLCGNIETSEKLKTLVSPWCIYGYDVLVYAGKSLFIKCLSEKQILKKLKRKNIHISARGIAYLARKFIIYLALVHRESHGSLKEAMCVRGGYILHLDSTCEGDSPQLMSGLDGISKLVLDNIKLPSEKAEKIIPFLNRVKNAFGTPLALVHDRGKGILSAVAKVFPGVADYVCHFHFLRDIGNDLFSQENDIIRNRLKHHACQGKLRKNAIQLKNIIDQHPGLTDSLVRCLENGKIDKSDFEYLPIVAAYSIIQWALDGKNRGRGYGFPFDRPYLMFYQRLQRLYTECKKIHNTRANNCIKDNSPFIKIYHLLCEALDDKELSIAALKMQQKAHIFDKFRDSMRIANPDDSQGLNDNAEDGDIKTIEKRVKDFRQWLVNDIEYSQNKYYHKMVGQIDEYWEKLFADPITVNTKDESITIQPQRTNNLLERFFRDLKRDYRRKSGLNSMGKTLKAMLADTPLVKNLDNKEYLDIVLNGKANLQERFAEIDAKVVREELRKSQDSSNKVPLKIRKIIKKVQLPEAIVNLFMNN